MGMSQRIQSNWLSGGTGLVSAAGTTGATRSVTVFWRIAVLTLAAFFMLAASFIPWQVDPLGSPLLAWQLPLHFGWQMSGGGWSALLNYGVLCFCCALIPGWLALQTWRRRKERALIQTGLVTTRQCRAIALLCLLPGALFVTQTLYMDMGGLMDMTNKEIQMLLIRGTFGYGSDPQFLPLLPFFIDPLDLSTRVALLFNQITGGAYLPFFSVLSLLVGQRLFPAPARKSLSRGAWALLACVLLLVLVVLGRTPIALACTFEADHLLMQGNYTGALHWLDRAVWLNPSLDRVPGYHIKRGQAWYYLHPNQPTSESLAYRAAFYRQQNDLLAAYQELLAARRLTPDAPWLLDETRVTLMRLADLTHPLRGASAQRLDNERRSLPWLHALVQVDPGNVYANYTIGRISYDMSDYATCERQMSKVLGLTSSNEIVSSAYTYLGLSRAQQGDKIAARDYLFKAQAFDIEYRNNTAREALSGVR